MLSTLKLSQKLFAHLPHLISSQIFHHNKSIGTIHTWADPLPHLKFLSTFYHRLKWLFRGN